MKKRALISVYNKEGIVDFACKLQKEYGYEILSTGGTAELLKRNNVPVIEVTEITKFPEMLEGRVKTLHPAVHGGLLARRDKKKHMQTIEKYDIKPIDMVVVNLYPFEEVILKSSVSLEEAIENIDIGGPSMLRSAAKNYLAVTVISDPEDYDLVLKNLEEHNGLTTETLRQKLALKAFHRTSEYDNVISNYFSDLQGQSANGVKQAFPGKLNLSLKLKKVLRYGENPHQNAALYMLSDTKFGLANAEVLQGKELSFNNYLDLESAWNTASEFDAMTPVAVIVKHNNPCGVAIAPDLYHAYIEALSCDSVSAFGGIVSFNGKIDVKVAHELTSMFLEAVIAPDYSEEVLEVFKKKPNLRVLKIVQEPNEKSHEKFDIKRISEGFLVQDFNSKTIDKDGLKVVTKRKPTDQEMLDLIFAWKVCKHVKSNAIVIAKDGKTLGIGAGQTSRVAAVEIAISQANYNSKGAVMASDAFFPFKDSIEIATSARISAIIQPGGSVKDKEVIEVCDKYNIAMVFTGIRHFRH